MMIPSMTYDIRTNEYAQQILSNIIGMPILVWEQYRGMNANINI